MQALLFPSKAMLNAHQARDFRIAGRTYRTTEVFELFWRFAAERHSVFQRRLRGVTPVTEDPVLAKFKFTNAFRILDRTTQYLVREVISKGDQSATELFFRIVLFKLFNKIETWELLTQELGEIQLADYRFDRYDEVLTRALAAGRRVYSAAYIMPSGRRPGESRKHRSHLKLLEAMVRDKVPARLQEVKTMSEGFDILRAYPMIGNFLAYQFVTDINYSSITNFTEMEFVAPGPGALDGLKKCFPEMGAADARRLIHFVCENQCELQRDFGLPPVVLGVRPLQLIDCQNLFCETDKYARVAYPHIAGFSGRTRIKQAFRATGPIPPPIFPEKWGMGSVGAT